MQNWIYIFDIVLYIYLFILILPFDRTVDNQPAVTIWRPPTDAVFGRRRIWAVP